MLYRGVDFNFISAVFGEDIADKMKNKQVKDVETELWGMRYKEPGFMSTSYKKEDAFEREILLLVNAPKGLNAVVIDEISLTNQKEVLINKGYSWEITNVSYNNKWILNIIVR